MVENFLKNFEKVMKKNFTNIFVLTILEKEPSHGYKIRNEIEKRTIGMWKPTASTLYWILNNLRENGFIKLLKENKKKVYEITDTGRETLRLMKSIQRKIRKSYHRFLAVSRMNGDSIESKKPEHYEDDSSIQMLLTSLRPDKYKELTLISRFAMKPS